MLHTTGAYIGINVAGLAGAILLLRWLTRRTGDWLSFAHLFSAVWVANILVAQLALEGRLRPDADTLAVLYGAWWMFLAGAGWGAGRSLRGRPSEFAIEQISGVAVLVALVLLQLAAFAFEVVSQQLSLGAFLASLWRTGAEFRLDDVYSTVEYPFSFSIWRWGHVFYLPLALALHSRRLISGRSLAAVVALAVVMAFGRYTRAPVVQVAVISLVSWAFLYRPSRRAKIIVAVAIGAAAFGAFAVSQINLMLSDAPSGTTPLESVFGYLGGSPLAYQALLRGDVPREAGIYSLDVVNYLLFKMSLIDHYIGVVRPYADLPMTTNIYTFLDAYTLDAGIGGALAGAFVTAALVAAVARRLNSQPSYASLTLYAYLSYCCVMAAANNEFIRTGVFINAGLAWLIGRMVRVRPRAARRVVRLVGTEA